MIVHATAAAAAHGYSRAAEPGAEDAQREEQRSHPELKKTRYLWLKRPSRLTDRQRESLAGYRRRHRNLARAYQLKLEFDELWEQPTELAEPYLADWCERVCRGSGQ